MATTMKLIGKVTLGSAAGTITFSSIPATFTDLYLAYSLRSTWSVAVDVYVSLNGTSTDYVRRLLYTTGSSALSYTDPLRILGAIAGDNFTANTFSSTEVYIPNYGGSTHKSMSITNTAENNGTSVFLEANSVLWSNSSAITSIQLAPGAGNFATNSSAFLYGITKA